MKNTIVNVMVKILVVLLIIAVIVLGIYIYSNAKQDTKQTSRLESEIDYLDTKLTSLINKLNGINLEDYKISISKVEETEESNTESTQKESSKKEEIGEENESKEEVKISKMEEEKTVADEENVDWKWIQGETEILYSTWATIVLDLHNEKINSEKIVGFSNTLDEALIAIKSNEKTLSAMFIAKLYNFLAEFANDSQIEEFKKNVIQTKRYILNAYAYVQDENWEKVQEEAVKSKESFSKITSDIENSGNQRKNNINKTYILIEELKNSLATKDQEIFYIKYKNLLEEINTLM